MNATTTLVLACGGLLGAAMAVLVVALTRRVPVLTDALAALDERRPTPPASSAGVGGRARWVLPLLRRLPAHVPAQDLDLLDLSRDRVLIGAAGSALMLAAAGPVVGMVVTALDLGVPLVMPAGVSVAGLVLGWTRHLRRIRDRANDARDEMRSALVSVMQQVGLLRRGGAGAATALSLPTKIRTRSWTVRRLREELQLAERSGEMPWEGLRRFAERAGITDLASLSQIAAHAGQSGAAVVDTLLARAESLRDELQAGEHADAYRASAQMSAPGAVMTSLIALWVLFPAGVALLGSL